MPLHPMEPKQQILSPESRQLQCFMDVVPVFMVFLFASSMTATSAIDDCGAQMSMGHFLVDWPFPGPFLEAFGLNAVYRMAPGMLVSLVYVHCNTSESPPS
ncbi:C6 transcription factor [Penicillium mononematosum]|uniref:C6 transcription factor n=1 Tax=Penicillium mononematosum TaxID=268346 RepID=UPI00254946AA|nr:C6 transcription factor [Penicillium mononematosum]KAJ6186191.1 C6 transcription factor [Penicillium mononematosum]